MTVPAQGHAYLAAPDSFKGTLGATEVAAAIARGIERAGGEARLCPVADGGEGTMAVLVGALGGELVSAPAHDPLGRPIQAEFAILDNGGDAVVEAAKVSGLGLVSPGERDAESASTRGTGELIAAAIEAGARRVLVAAGGDGDHGRRRRRDRGADGGGRRGWRPPRGDLRRPDAVRARR